MRCEQSQLLGPLIDDELSPAAADAARAHLAACPACEAEADELRALRRLMAASARHGTLGDPSAEAMDRLRAHVRGLVETADVGLVWMARVFSGVAACVLIGGLWLLGRPAAVQSSPAVPWDQIAVNLVGDQSAASDSASEQPESPLAASPEPVTRDAVLAELSGVADASAAKPDAGRAGEGDLP